MTTNNNVYNSEDFQVPEFTVEVTTSYGKMTVEAYNVGAGFVLEHPMITPTLCSNTANLPIALEQCTDKLEHSLDTMT